MSHCVTQVSPPFFSRDGSVEVHQIPSGQDNLVWLLVCARSREAVVVDGPDAVALLHYLEGRLEGRDIKLRAVLNTHTHHDHIGINLDLQAKGKLAGLEVYGAKRTAEAVPGLTVSVEHGDEVRFGEVKGSVMLTEGHIRGHLSFLFDNVLLCGDTMFGAGCGYLFQGDPGLMYRSLMRLAALPGDTMLCCAHEYTQDNLRFAWSVEPDNEALASRIRKSWALREDGASTVPSNMEEERLTNPFLRQESTTLVASLRAAMGDGCALDTPEQIFAATRSLKDRRDYRKRSDDALPLER